MPRLPFLIAEDGAVTVDWVVLTAGAAAVALATAGVLSAGLSQSNRAVEEEMGLTGTVGETWAAAMRNYLPYNDVTYSQHYNDFTTLTDEELDEMEKFVNDTLAEWLPKADTADKTGALNDLTFAIGLVYAERVLPRPGATGADEAKITAIADKLGWKNLNVK